MKFNLEYYPPIISGPKMRLNKIQLNALKRLYDREKPALSFLNFRRDCFPEIGARDTALIVHRGVTFGIEPDGHIHT
jgi:hypothetical protein